MFEEAVEPPRRKLKELDLWPPFKTIPWDLLQYFLEKAIAFEIRLLQTHGAQQKGIIIINDGLALASRTIVNFLQRKIREIEHVMGIIIVRRYRRTCTGDHLIWRRLAK